MTVRQIEATSEDIEPSWDAFVPYFVHPTQVIIIETMRRIGRPTSATELKEVVGGDPALSSLSFHLKQLVSVGILEVVAKLKVRKSQGPNKETFFYFIGQPQWALPIALLNDPADPLTKAALRLQASPPRRPS